MKELFIEIVKNLKQLFSALKNELKDIIIWMVKIHK
tara:strand:- start:6260 stop:6367 length:108 start_codon:yes stop_codon:yes gene_type:complete